MSTAEIVVPSTAQVVSNYVFIDPFDTILTFSKSTLVLYISSVTQRKSQIHVFFLLVRVKRLIMLMTVGMFSGYIRDTPTSVSFLMSPPLGYGGILPLMELNSLKIIPVSHLPPIISCPICAAGIHDEVSVRSQKEATVALRSDIVSLTRISSISCISSPICIGGHTSTN